MAGVGRVEFLLTLESHEVFPFEAELGNLEDRAAPDGHELPSPNGAQ